MTTQPDIDFGAHWDVLGAEVPDDLAGVRVLDVGGAGDHVPSSAPFHDRGAADVIRCRVPSDLEGNIGADFGLVYCRDSLQLDPHPMNLLTRLWHVTDPEAVLLLESRILSDSEQSRYGRFVAAEEGEDSPAHFVPGRLALRWMVEVSGFDVDRWLPSEARADDRCQVSAYLRGTRVARQPALDLATPARSE